VGGCVRDRLLGVSPKDYDVSTDATPNLIASLFQNSQLVGAHFGVVIVTGTDAAAVEVATFRSEGVYTDGRRPDSVRFETDPSLDARRRDFTINGLFEDPLSGEVLDYVGGRDDLAAGLIRAIGNPVARFEEDHLRMLRAVRLAARFQFSIHGETQAAIQQLASSICRISPERIRDELVRIWTEHQPRRGLELLDRCGLLQHLLPEISALQGVAQPPEYHPEGDVWTHVLLMLQQMTQPTPTLAWGVLYHDVGKPKTFRVADRIRFDGHAEVGATITRSRLSQLRLPTGDIDHVTSMVANHMRFKDVRNMRLSTLKRFLRLPRFDEHLELHRLDCLASNGYRDSYEFVKQKLAEFRHAELRPVRLISGDDLIARGFRPGPLFKSALEAVETAQLDGTIHTHQEALALAEALLRNEARVTASLRQLRH
jgi:poly(A) polymerase